MKKTVTSISALLLAGCAYPYTPPALAPITAPPPAAASGSAPAPAAATAEVRAPVTILVSIDGFRSDYLQRAITPNLSALAKGGVQAAMRPSFPSLTFPNHWTLVTGLRPDRNGIVGNKMVDPRRPDETFGLSSDEAFWWNEASPIWVDAERAGIPTATMFWPGANVAWGSTEKKDSHGITSGGTRPGLWMQYNANMRGDQRVDAVVDWLRRPAATRPRLVTLYFDTVDSAGHDAGPDSATVNAAVADVDRSIGRLVAGLAALGQPANLVIVADHGMAATSTDRLIAIDRIANPADYRVVEDGAFATLAPMPGREAALDRALIRPHDHMTCWRKADIPARLHYGRNARVSPYLCLAEVGWLVRKTTPTTPKNGGDHGYDNMAPEMRALFVANGPAFRAGRTLPGFDNVDVEPLLRDLIGLPRKPGLDGDDAPFQKVMR